jgi:ribulose-phosphate 3-epimerase
VAKVAVTIDADTPADFAARIDRVKGFANRIHVDISDGVFAPHKTVGISQAYGVEGAELDLHMMVEYPQSQIEKILAFEPNLVILHFESAGGHLKEVFSQLKDVGIRTGLAIEHDTTIEQIKDWLPELDHLLVFTGKLGFNGGEMRVDCLDKIAEAKTINPDLEVGVDGGINQETARYALNAGADVLDTGSFVHDAIDPEAAYLMLEAIASGETQ